MELDQKIRLFKVDEAVMFFIRVYMKIILLYVYLDRRTRNPNFNDDFTSILKFHLILLLIVTLVKLYAFRSLDIDVSLTLISISCGISAFYYFGNREYFTEDIVRIEALIRKLFQRKK